MVSAKPNGKLLHTHPCPKLSQAAGQKEWIPTWDKRDLSKHGMEKSTALDKTPAIPSWFPYPLPPNLRAPAIRSRLPPPPPPSVRAPAIQPLTLPPPSPNLRAPAIQPLALPPTSPNLSAPAIRSSLPSAPSPIHQESPAIPDRPPLDDPESPAIPDRPPLDDPVFGIIKPPVIQDRPPLADPEDGYSMNSDFSSGTDDDAEYALPPENETVDVAHAKTRSRLSEFRKKYDEGDLEGYVQGITDEFERMTESYSSPHE
ncbi:uncharacterized protein LOC135154502 [Lytechinus pictus]|uniref:uncharacterized protein LOC135154502 n=1 Tax=Lytechinus pictus TaxID=7653 RepID=UPI0030BA06DD